MIIYFKWLLFLVTNLVTNFISLFLNPFVVLFATKEDHLPRWLSWFDTPDNPLSGDNGWITKNRPFINENSRFKRYINRVAWLERNRLYGFSRSVLSVHYQPANGDWGRIIGDPDIGNGGPLAKSGWYYKTLLDCRGKLKGFEWYCVRQYKRWPHSCIRLLIGWKCPEAGDGDTVCTFGFSINFFQHFGS